MSYYYHFLIVVFFYWSCLQLCNTIRFNGLFAYLDYLPIPAVLRLYWHTAAWIIENPLYKQMIALLLKIFLFWFRAVNKLQLASYSHKTVPHYLKHSVLIILWLVFLYSRHVINRQVTPILLNTCVAAGCNKFASD